MNLHSPQDFLLLAVVTLVLLMLLAIVGHANFIVALGIYKYPLLASSGSTDFVLYSVSYKVLIDQLRRHNYYCLELRLGLSK